MTSGSTGRLGGGTLPTGFAGISRSSSAPYKMRFSSERQAIAGYYQGLRSVRENGMYSDTKRYVANVMYLKQRFS